MSADSFEENKPDCGLCHGRP